MKSFLLLLSISTMAFYTQDADALFCGKKCKAKKAAGKKAAANGDNCSQLKGKAKRVCKRTVRKTARKEAKELGLKGKEKRQYKRDAKARQGAYSFIGSKKANNAGAASWQQYELEKQELENLYASGQIGVEEYNHRMMIIENNRKSRNMKIGREKTIKTVVAAGAVATGGIVGAAAVGTAYSIDHAVSKKRLKNQIAQKKLQVEQSRSLSSTDEFVQEVQQQRFQNSVQAAGFADFKARAMNAQQHQNQYLQQLSDDCLKQGKSFNHIGAGKYQCQ